MKIVTLREVIQNVPEKWQQQYHDDLSQQKRQIDWRLQALDTSTATPTQVAEIIGNDSWTDLHCYECERQVELLVDFGEYDYDTPYFRVCLECLKKAIAAVTSKGTP